MDYANTTLQVHLPSALAYLLLIASPFIVQLVKKYIQKKFRFYFAIGFSGLIMCIGKILPMKVFHGFLSLIAVSYVIGVIVLYGY